MTQASEMAVKLMSEPQSCRLETTAAGRSRAEAGAADAVASPPAAPAVRALRSSGAIGLEPRYWRERRVYGDRKKADQEPQTPVQPPPVLVWSAADLTTFDEMTGKLRQRVLETAPEDTPRLLPSVVLPVAVGLTGLLWLALMTGL